MSGIVIYLMYFCDNYFMEFIEKISTLRINWEGQTHFIINDPINDLDLLFGNDSRYCSMKNEILSYEFILNMNGDFAIDRFGLESYWNSQNSVGSKMLLTLFWGGLHKTRNYKSHFVRFFRKTIQLLSDFQSDDFQKSINWLFLEFENNKKIEGVGYAFFSKFFQFAKPESDFVICDQWTMKSIATYLILKNEHEKLRDIFSLSVNNKSQTINIQLRKVENSCSDSYVKFIQEFRRVTIELTAVLPRIDNDIRLAEEVLFGWNRKVVQDGYDNPRYFYQEVIFNYLKISKPTSKIFKERISENLVVLDRLFIFKQPKAKYYSLRVSPNDKKKIGYFDNNAWLCLHKDFLHLIKNVEWQIGNTKGGSETHKCRFTDIPELIRKIEDSGLVCEFLN